MPTPTDRKQHRARRNLRTLMTLFLVFFALAALEYLPLFGSELDPPAALDPPQDYYYQPDNQVYLKLLDKHERDVTEIVRQRMQKIWGPDATPYLQDLIDNPYHGYYQSDSVLSQRRTIWRSSLFAKDLDFIEVSISTFDGRFSLRETYAINRNDNRWTVIDSAGFPLFERILDVTSDNIDTREGRKRFLLTLLSYAGYGSYDILSHPDTMYHEIDLAKKLDEDYYPYKSVTRGDTTETTFTCCLRGGVEVSRWRIKYFGDGLLIDESEQLVTYEDLPKDESAAGTEPADTSKIAGLLTDVASDSGADSSTTDSAGRAIAPPRPQAPGGDIRLADLLQGKVKPAPSNGHVSYEILSVKLIMPTDSTPIEREPEFTRFAEPEYPPEALARGAEGEVEIMLRVDSTGKARQAMIRKKSGKDVGFEISAKRAAQRSEFRPGTAGGKPVDMWLTYKLSFRMAGTRYKNNKPAKPDDQQTSNANNDTAIADTAKVDSAQMDTTTSDTTHSDTIRSDTTHGDTIDSDTVNSHTVNSDSAVADTLLDTASAKARADSAKADTTKSDSTQADSTLPDSTVPDSNKADTTRGGK